MRLDWTRDADNDLGSIEEYVGRDNAESAFRILAETVRQVEMLEEHPGMGRPGRVEGTRELVIAGLPYVVAYLHRGDTVTVLRVLHGAMKWPKRF
ncbi:MAG: type II toxin-antitoxin system RelE/ParE family toxin [Candidatus Binatus sp.]|uniref:type II toxin-antitoxin system RelE/ParE family toxin n=1 Tax=Candidatus Binatus sp. TaxID=2811406 RepID=UPI003BB147C2